MQDDFSPPDSRRQREAWHGKEVFGAVELGFVGGGWFVPRWRTS